MPKSSELLGKALLVAGFQNREPVASIGAATAAPAIERLIGPAPVKTGPICARAGKALQANARKERAIAFVNILQRRGMERSLRNGFEKIYGSYQLFRFFLLWGLDHFCGSCPPCERELSLVGKAGLLAERNPSLFS